VICVFSQYGEVVDINMIRDKETGQSKGFAFLGYMDQRSTILAVDNLNGSRVLGRVLRVDHVAQYKRKEGEEMSYNAAPEPFLVDDEPQPRHVDTVPADMDRDDPMYEHLLSKRKRKHKRPRVKQGT
jgi:RNA-binding motif X-linked protein 2